MILVIIANHYPIFAMLFMQLRGLFNRDGDNKELVMETKAKLGAKAIGHRGMKNVEGYEIKERQSPYNRVFGPEKCGLRLKNDHIWHVF